MTEALRREDPRKQAVPDEPAKRICYKTTRELVGLILTFTEELTATKLYNYQIVFAARVVESVLENDQATITALWARQSGKTEVIAHIGLGLAVLMPILANSFPDDPRLGAYRRGFRVGIFAPVQDQATISFTRMRERVASDEFKAITEDPEIDIQVVANRGDTLAFSNGSYIKARTASPDSQIEGGTFELVVCEESQKLSKTKVEKEIRPMLAATAGSMIKIGTAWESRGGFHTDIQHNEEIHRKGGKRNHFEFPYDKVIAERRKLYEKDGNVFHIKYEKFVMGEIHRLGGTDSLEFKMNFRCLWNESRVIAITDAMMDGAEIPDLECGPNRIGFQVAGLDLGKHNDSTVLTLMQVDYDRPIFNMVSLPGADEDKQVYYPKTIIDWLELDGVFEGSSGQYQAIVAYLRFVNVRVLCVDATGLGGDVIFERLEAMIGDRIAMIPFVFGTATKSNGYKYYLQELTSHRLFYAAGPKTKEDIRYKRFRQENLDLERGRSGNYVTIAAPDEEGYHDDYPDSAMLACWAEKEAQKVMMPEVEVVNQGFSKGGGRGGGVESSGPSRGTNRYASGRRR